MAETVSHTVDYTIDELKNMVQPSTYEYVNVFENVPVHQIMDINPLPGEVFRKHPKHTCIEISNFGRIKLDNKIVEQWDDDPHGKGWLYVKIGNILSYPKYVYRFVAETWCKHPDNTEGLEVHHITNNGYDNRPANLLWIKSALHRQIPTIR